MSKTPAITNVTIKQSSHSMISLSWDTPDGFRYHIWADRNGTFDNPETLFKNRDNGSLKSYDPGYYRCHHLNPTANANAKMIAAAKDIALRCNLFTKARAEFDAKQAAEQADLTERVRKNTRAKELFAAMQAYLDTPGDQRGLFALEADDMACLLIYRPTEH